MTNITNTINKIASEALFQSTCEGITPTLSSVNYEIGLAIDFAGITFNSSKAKISFISLIHGNIAKLNTPLFNKYMKIRRYDADGKLTLDSSKWV